MEGLSLSLATIRSNSALRRVLNISLRVLKSLPQQSVSKPVVLITMAHPLFKKSYGVESTIEYNHNITFIRYVSIKFDIIRYCEI